MPFEKIKLCCYTKDGVTCSGKPIFKFAGLEKYVCRRHIKIISTQNPTETFVKI